MANIALQQKHALHPQNPRELQCHHNNHGNLKIAIITNINLLPSQPIIGTNYSLCPGVTCHNAPEEPTSQIVVPLDVPRIQIGDIFLSVLATPVEIFENK